MTTHRLQSFSSSKLPNSFIKDHLTIGELDRIKSKIAKPFLKAWTVIHEGVAKAFDIETGQDIEIEYSRDVVKKSPSVNGLEFYDGHNKDNSKGKDRLPAGFVVKEVEYEHEGKLHRVAIGAFDESKKSIAEKSDIVSPEFGASFLDHLSSAGRFIAESISDVTAIALGKSSKDTPGFPGALEIAALQAFKNNNKENQMATREEIMSGMNTDIVREWMNKNPNVLIGMIVSEDRYMPDWHEDTATKRGYFKNGEKNIRKALNEIVERHYKAEDKVEVLEKEKGEFEKSKTRIEAIPSVISFIESKNFPDSAKAVLTEQIQKLDLEKYGKDKTSAIKDFVESVMDKELEGISRWQGKEEADKKKAEWFSDKKTEQKKETLSKEKKPSYLKPGEESEKKEEDDLIPDDEE